jgi:dipeptidyl-peptidase III
LNVVLSLTSSQGSGDQKFVPSLSSAALEKLSRRSPKLQAIYERICDAIKAVPPYGLGFSSDTAQSAYYPGEARINQDEIAAISHELEKHAIYPENTRIQKISKPGETKFEVLQASVEEATEHLVYDLPDFGAGLAVTKGDHTEELAQICVCLTEAKKHATNETQELLLSQYIESFKTGDLEVYRDSQRTWIKDKGPRVENIFGFVEPYRDPYGIPAKFEGLVAITDLDETRMLMKLVENSSTFIKRLPWPVGRTTMARDLLRRRFLSHQIC